MVYKSFDNLLFELSEATTKEEKQKLIHDYMYINLDKIEYINWPPKQKEKVKTYYAKELVNKFCCLSEYDRIIINNIFNDYLNQKKIVYNKDVKRVLINYFNIRKSSDLHKIKYYYFLYQGSEFKSNKLIDNNPIMNNDRYISIVLSKKRKKELGIEKVSDCFNKHFNTIERDLIYQYNYCIKKYCVNDKLFLSIVKKEYRELLLLYLEGNSFNKVGKIINIAPSTIRCYFYTAIKGIIDFFHSEKGIVALWIIFSSHDGYVEKKEIDSLFNKYNVVFHWIVGKNLIYFIEYDKDKDCYIFK